MPKLVNALGSWATGHFEKALKQELERLPSGMLPLEQGTTQGGQVQDGNIAVTVIGVKDTGGTIAARAGVFFDEVVGGCSCGDEPVAENTYCEIGIVIDKASGEAQFEILPATEHGG